MANDYRRKCLYEAGINVNRDPRLSIASVSIPLTPRGK